MASMRTQGREARVDVPHAQLDVVSAGNEDEDDAMKRCSHRSDVWIVRGKSLDGVIGGLFIDQAKGHTFHAQSISVCRTCGAVRIGQTKWGKPLGATP